MSYERQTTGEESLSMPGIILRKRALVLVLVSQLLFGAALPCLGPGTAFAEPPAGLANDAAAGAAALPQDGKGTRSLEYHTPLAGEAGQARFLGYQVQIPAMDRGHMTSITFGASGFQPKQGDTIGVPFGALYLRHVWDDSRTRDLISIFSNEAEYDKSFGHLEAVGYLESYTIPVPQTELVENREVKATAANWGTVLGSVGPGLRFPVAPFEVDNDLRLQLLGRAGYFYAGRADRTGATQVLPPSTFLYGAKLRLRYDNMRRNLLELPHHGWATGFDIDFLRRDQWHDLGVVGTPSASNNREYLQARGYLVGASAIPGLSERHRLVYCLYGGTTAGGRGDRFNAFRINGGPFPGEAEDLARQHYTDLIYNDILATKYATATLGYRRELCFFIYLSLVGSYIWADRATVQADEQVVFREKTAAAGTASLDTAFLWNSEFHLAYVWDSGMIRGGKAGNGLLLTWNKLF